MTILCTVFILAEYVLHVSLLFELAEYVLHVSLLFEFIRSVFALESRIARIGVFPKCPQIKNDIFDIAD